SCKKSGKRVVGEKAICLVKQPWLVHLVKQPRLLIGKIFLSTTERTVRRYLGRKRDHAVFNASTAISDASKRLIDLVEQPTVPKNPSLDTAVPKKPIRRSLSVASQPRRASFKWLKCRASLGTAALRTACFTLG
uniref:Transposase n=1 Tax=Macrostomum lignano TaxID=282301 RepID=A0A1I8J962_9PLAT